MILAAVRPGGYWVTYQPPDDPTPPRYGATPARIGSLGMADREASILVRTPHLPRWVTRPGTTWNVSVR